LAFLRPPLGEHDEEGTRFFSGSKGSEIQDDHAPEPWRERGVAIYRDEELGVQCEIHTQKVNGEWGKGVKTFYIDGDEKEYSDIHSLMAALSERV
jgi:hypothetical protein